MINVIMVKTDAMQISFQASNWMEVVTRCIRYTKIEKENGKEIHKVFVYPSPQDPGISEYPVEQMEQDLQDGWIPELEKSKTITSCVKCGKLKDENTMMRDEKSGWICIDCARSKTNK